MGERYAQPWRVDRKPREEVMKVMSLTEGRSTAQIAASVKKAAGTIDQLLWALHADGCVERDRGPTAYGSAQKWRLTGTPLPVAPTSTADVSTKRHVVVSGDVVFDDHALCEAMGMPWSDCSALIRQPATFVRLEH